MQIQKRIESHFAEYRKKGSFVDCTITFEDHSIHAHRLILAKYSKYFFDEFINNPQCPYTFKPTYDPDNMLEKVVDFLYENSIDITPDNAIALLAISRYYKIENLEQIVSSYLPPHIRQDTALGFCSKCVQFNIQDQAKYFVPTIAQNWNIYDRRKIYKNIDPTILSLILHDPNMSDINPDAKIQIIDDFFEASTEYILTDSQRESLTDVIDWTSDNAYQYLTRHECNWIHPRTARPLLRRIMKERRASILKLDDEIKQSDISASADSSKWFLFTRMINIKKANPETSDEELVIPAINYISTFGDFVEGFDAVVTGSINVDSSQPMSINIKPNYALGFSKGPTFVTIGSDTADPYYEIDFGTKAKLIARKLMVACSSEKRREEKIRLLKTKTKETDYLSPNPLKVQVIGHQAPPNERDIVLYDGDYSNEIDISTSDCIPLTKIKFIQNGQNCAGGYILRIYSIEILGQFVL